MTLDVLFPAKERLEFTQVSFMWLIANTDWSLVNRLVVYDDHSTDGTSEWLAENVAAVDGQIDCGVSLRRPNASFQSPVAIMADYLHDTPVDWFAKVDNDVAVCEGWLDELIDVVKRNPQVDLLGMEAGMTSLPGAHSRSFQPARHIGGIGLMRVEAFTRGFRSLVAFGRYWGFTEWQHRSENVVKGWITPDLPCPLLDRLPIEPYRSLSESYVEKGWQRGWSHYDPRGMEWAWEWMTPVRHALEAGHGYQ